MVPIFKKPFIIVATSAVYLYSILLPSTNAIPIVLHYFWQIKCILFDFCNDLQSSTNMCDRHIIFFFLITKRNNIGKNHEKVLHYFPSNYVGNKNYDIQVSPVANSIPIIDKQIFFITGVQVLCVCISRWILIEGFINKISNSNQNIYMFRKQYFIIKKAVHSISTRHRNFHNLRHMRNILKLHSRIHYRSDMISIHSFLSKG